MVVAVSKDRHDRANAIYAQSDNQGRTATKTVGKRAIHDLHQAKGDHKDINQQLHAIAVFNAKIVGDRAKGRQKVIN